MDRFFVWFEEAQAIPFGRTLINFELFSEKEGKVVEYRTFTTDWMKPPKAVAEERRMGLVKGVAVHLFANGIIAVRRGDRVLVVEWLLDTGEGRSLFLPELEADGLLHLIAMNRSSGWLLDDGLAQRPDTVHEKGRDYTVAEVEIFAYDPTSRTTFLTYRAENGRVVQINMSTGTAMRLFREVADGLQAGRAEWTGVAEVRKPEP